MRRTRGTVTTPPTKRPARSYAEIVRQVVNAAAFQLQELKRPEFDIGPPTKPMLTLAKRHRQATQTIRRCDQQLERLGARMESGSLVIHYRVQRTQEQAWSKRRAAAETTLRELKLAALIDLIDLPPAAAMLYLRKLQASCTAAVEQVRA